MTSGLCLVKAIFWFLLTHDILKYKDVINIMIFVKGGKGNRTDEGTWLQEMKEITEKVLKP